MVITLLPMTAFADSDETDTRVNYIYVYARKPSHTNSDNINTLDPIFDKATRNYTLNISDTEYNEIFFHLDVAVEGQSAFVTVDGVTLQSGYNPSIKRFRTVGHPLTKAKTVFVFAITSKDGTKTENYTVTVNRELSESDIDTKLKEIEVTTTSSLYNDKDYPTLVPIFDPETRIYTLSVPTDYDAISFYF